MFWLETQYLLEDINPLNAELNPICYLLALKAIPLQAWKGREGSRRLRLPDFKTVGTSRW